MADLASQPASWHATSPHALAHLFTDFMTLADRLAMPNAERAGIIGVSEAELRLMSRCGSSAAANPTTMARRIGYAIPLMSKIAQTHCGEAPQRGPAPRRTAMAWSNGESRLTP